jgi:hypothetical protein
MRSRPFHMWGQPLPALFASWTIGPTALKMAQGCIVYWTYWFVYGAGEAVTDVEGPVRLEVHVGSQGATCGYVIEPVDYKWVKMEFYWLNMQRKADNWKNWKHKVRTSHFSLAILREYSNHLHSIKLERSDVFQLQNEIHSLFNRCCCIRILTMEIHECSKSSYV